jgi:hypothetical protein
MYKLNEERQELMKTVTKYYKYVFLGLVLLAVSGCKTTGPKKKNMADRKFHLRCLSIKKLFSHFEKKN